MELLIFLGIIIILYFFGKYLNDNGYNYKKEKPININKTMIINEQSSSRMKATSSITKGIVGGTLLGPIGAIGGLASGKKKISSFTTFLIEYEDGSRKTKKVKTNSKEYDYLCQFLDM